MKRYPGITLVLVALLLGGCAFAKANYQHEKAHLAAIHAAAGKPVGSFNDMLTTVYSWEPLNESELLIYTRPHQAWLLNVGLCPQLPYTPTIGLTSHVGQVSVGLDSVLVAHGHFPCTIQKIQPVDVKELHRKMDVHKGGKIVSKKASGSTAQ